MIDLGIAGPALAAFVVIVPAELPDKTFIATLVLATRFRPLAVWLGACAAFAVQCLVAVAAGGLLALLPRTLVLAASAVLFGVGAALMLRGGLRTRAQEQALEAAEADDTEAALAARIRSGDADASSTDAGSADARSATSMRRALLTTFVVLFAAEWGDLSQLITAGLAARYHAPVAVFIGSLAALMLVAGIGALAGRWLQARVPLARVRLIAAALLAVLALVSLAEAVHTL